MLKNLAILLVAALLVSGSMAQYIVARQEDNQAWNTKQEQQNSKTVSVRGRTISTNNQNTQSQNLNKNQWNQVAITNGLNGRMVQSQTGQKSEYIASNVNQQSMSDSIGRRSNFVNSNTQRESAEATNTKTQIVNNQGYLNRVEANQNYQTQDTQQQSKSVSGPRGWSNSVSTQDKSTNYNQNQFAQDKFVNTGNGYVAQQQSGDSTSYVQSQTNSRATNDSTGRSVNTVSKNTQSASTSNTKTNTVTVNNNRGYVPTF